MAKARKLTASERDGVQYNRAKRWQIVRLSRLHRIDRKEPNPVTRGFGSLH